jgi:miniconductance mechanosensitive channel
MLKTIFFQILISITTHGATLDPTSKGMPLEIYCFMKKTWEKYEGITSDILIIY